MPPQTHADTGDQLAQRKRLRDVVVGADLEPQDPVDLLAFGGQHDDGRLDPLLPELAADVEATHAGQHDVQQDQVRVLFDGEVDRRVAAAGRDDAVPLLLQVELQALRDVFFVFDDQDLLRHEPASLAGNTTRNRLPRPTSLCTSTRPPCASMMCLTR